MVYLDALDNFKPIREDYPKYVEKFADLLDVAVTSLKDAQRIEEFGNRTLCHNLQQKMKEMSKNALNALLDGGSTKTYINSDLAAELNLQGGTQKVTVNMLNGQLELLDGKVKITIQSFTANSVAGSLKPLHWNSMENKWHHLKKIKFPDVGPKPISLTS